MGQKLFWTSIHTQKGYTMFSTLKSISTTRWPKREMAIAAVLVLFFTCTTIPVDAQQRDRSENGSIKLPTGFLHEPLFSGLRTPTDMAILPSGDILVTEKGVGWENSSPTHIKLIYEANGRMYSKDLLTIATNAAGDSGLLGVILDPNFADNKRFYLWHSTPGTTFQWKLDGTAKYRLTRFTLDSVERKIVSGSALVILDNIERTITHGGGGLAFNNQGHLFVAIGDASEHLQIPHVSQDLTTPLGKILRIQPTDLGYTVPLDNPFIGRDDALPEIYALGLRNPFRMIHRPIDDSIYLGDVGENIWEELNLLQAGANFGWPMREGPCQQGMQLPCERTTNYSEPIMFYEHWAEAEPGRGGAITGIASYDGNQYPSTYHNKIFVADLNSQFIAAVEPSATGYYTGPHFAENMGAITDIEYFDESLYMLEISMGAISRIRYYGDESPPSADLRSDIVTGAAPLAVRLDGSNSNNPNGEPLLYEWHINDGSEITSTSVPTLEHTFLTDGDYQAALVVIDSEARRSPTATLSINVYSGELPEINIVHSNLLSRTTFHGGDEFIFWPVRTAGITDLEPTQPYTWDISLHHNQHSHPLVANLNTTSDSIRIPKKNHGNNNIWYEIGLTMHTENGQKIRVSKELRPQYTELEINVTQNISGTLTIDGQSYTFPNTHTMIVGMDYTVEMPDLVTKVSEFSKFDGWEDSPTGSQTNNSSSRVITLPPERSVITASYTELEPAKLFYVPFISQ